MSEELKKIADLEADKKTLTVENDTLKKALETAVSENGKLQEKLKEVKSEVKDMPKRASFTVDKTKYYVNLTGSTIIPGHGSVTSEDICENTDLQAKIVDIAPAWLEKKKS